MGTETTTNLIAGTTTEKYNIRLKTGAIQSGYNYSRSEQFKSVQTSRISVNTPGFPRASAAGLPMNPFRFAETDRSKFLGQWREDFPVSVYSNADQYWLEKTGVIINAHTESLLDFSYLEQVNQNNSVKAKLNMRLKDQKVNFAQFVAEREQLYKMLATNAARIRKAYSHLRHGDFVSAASALGLKFALPRGDFLKRFERNQSQAVASGWLELQYGWLPLLSDIFGAVEIFNNRNIEKPPVIVVRSKQSFVDSQTSKWASQGKLGFINKQVKRDVTIICHYSSSQQFVKTASELGLTNPIYLAWELLPFSFVVDWFAQVGNFVSSFDAALGTVFHKGCITSFTRKSLNYYIVGDGIKYYQVGSNHYACQSGYALCQDEDVVCTRDIFLTNPIPLFPVIKSPVSATHFANTLALLKQLLRK